MKNLWILLVIAVMTACGSKNNAEEKVAAEKSPEKTVNDSATAAKPADDKDVDAVTSATNVANAPTFNGVMALSPQHRATMSLTMGGRVHSLKVIEGQMVGKGQVIATIDNPDFIQLQQEYLDASAQHEYLDSEYKRQAKLAKEDAASQKKLEQTKADWLSMKSKVAASSARLRALGVDPATIHKDGIMPYLSVKATIGGYVTELNANIGKYIETGQALCDIINKQQPILELTVYEKDLSMMKVGRGMQFRVNGMGKQTFDAVIVSIDQTVDAKDYSVKVYARVKDVRPDFRPGMYVRARVK